MQQLSQSNHSRKARVSVVSLYMPRALDEKLEEFAAGQDRSKSYVMRQLLERALTTEEESLK